MRDRVTTIAAFANARWRWPKMRAELEETRDRKLDRFLSTVLPKAGFYRSMTAIERPLAAIQLEELPIVDKQTMLANFSGLNTRGITLDAAMDAAVAAERSRDFAPTVDGLTVGLSSGTSGQRGVFLVSARERQQWAGIVLAHLLSTDSLRRIAALTKPPLRIAFFLRANSNLYSTLSSGRIAFTFHDLLVPMSEHLVQLNMSRPDILVAPPTVLRHLAHASSEGALAISPSQIVSVAEVLEPDDRVAITAAFGVNVQEVYQATEGLLALSCSHGRLHLNEEHLYIEREWIDEHRFHPIITDFSRTTQIVARYRLDDVLRETERACECGRVTRSLEAIEGRADDVLWCRHASGEWRAMFPDTIRRAMALTGPALRDYRIEQRSDTWHVRVQCDSASTADVRRAIEHELSALALSLGVRLPALRFDEWTDTPIVQKRRRIRCIEKPAASVSA